MLYAVLKVVKLFKIAWTNQNYPIIKKIKTLKTSINLKALNTENTLKNHQNPQNKIVKDWIWLRLSTANNCLMSAVNNWRTLNTTFTVLCNNMK